MLKIFIIILLSSVIGGNFGDAKPQTDYLQKGDDTQKDEGGRSFGPMSPGQFYPMQGVNRPYGPEVYPGAYPSVYGGYYRPQLYGQSANYLQSFENYYRKNKN